MRSFAHELEVHSVWKPPVEGGGVPAVRLPAGDRLVRAARHRMVGDARPGGDPARDPERVAPGPADPRLRDGRGLAGPRAPGRPGVRPAPPAGAAELAAAVVRLAHRSC